MRRPINKRPTLCWSCARFSGRCSWSAHFEPVAGWNAEPDMLKLGFRKQAIQTYTVLQCPLYKKDAEKDGNERMEDHAAAQAL